MIFQHPCENLDACESFSFDAEKMRDAQSWQQPEVEKVADWVALRKNRI